MSRFLVPIGFVILMVLLYAGLSLNPRVIPSEFIGRTAPEINVADLYNESEIVKTSDMKGKVWLFNIWGTWCPECWREHNYLMELGRRGIPIVGLNWRDDRQEAKAMLVKMGNPFVKIGFDKDSSVAINWGVYGAPETFVINAEGIVVEKHTGGVTPAVWQQKFKKHFQKL